MIVAGGRSSLDYAWYRYPNDQVGRHPFDGITDPWYNPGDVKVKARYQHLPAAE
ncbi:hypothetical protein ACLB1Q_09765 [Escherichia coli]